MNQIAAASDKTRLSQPLRDLVLVKITDCIGLTLSFATLTDALLAMVPLPESGRREMLKGANPAWLPAVPGGSTQRSDSLLCRAGRLVSRIVAILSGRHRRERVELI